MTRESSWHQTNWDWRAAVNFVAGGSGAGLLCVAALQDRGHWAHAIIAMILIAGGLTAVWFEIGRPWRALNVFRHARTSWMSRESIVAVALFVVAALFVVGAVRFGAFAPWTVMVGMAAGLIGLIYLYTQARILLAAKGIPAWREPILVPFMIASGVVEGTGILFALGPILAMSASTLVIDVFIGLVAIRAFVWLTYLRRLNHAKAPRSACRVLRSVSPALLWGGHLLPIVLAGSSLGIDPGSPLFDGLVAIAGILALGAGWVAKYVIVARAGFNQGFALPRLPDRGTRRRRGAGRGGLEAATAAPRD